MTWIHPAARSISRAEVEDMCDRLIEESRSRLEIGALSRVLLLPPDLTRAHSGAGWITEYLYHRLTAMGADVHLIPTLGQHVPHTPEENTWMFGEVPEEKVHVRDLRGSVTLVGTTTAESVSAQTGGGVEWERPIALNAMLMEEPWDLIINVGHIVPHEVLGFANHNKNYFI